jgi:hypothetical protein
MKTIKALLGVLNIALAPAGRISAPWLLPLVLLLTLPVAVQAQFTYTTNADGASITITGYTGAGGAVIIPTNINNLPVTSIGWAAFYGCSSLTGVYFKGNAPSLLGAYAFEYTPATVYYLPGTTGWYRKLEGHPTALWVLPNPLILNNGPSFGVGTNGFGFIISWATNISVVVEASTNLVNPLWSPMATNTLTTGASYFSDPQWTNYPGRFYRIRSQ